VAGRPVECRMSNAEVSVFGVRHSAFFKPSLVKNNCTSYFCAHDGADPNSGLRVSVYSTDCPTGPGIECLL